MTRQRWSSSKSRKRGLLGRLRIQSHTTTSHSSIPASCHTICFPPLLPPLAICSLNYSTQGNCLHILTHLSSSLSSTSPLSPTSAPLLSLLTSLRSLLPSAIHSLNYWKQGNYLLCPLHASLASSLSILLLPSSTLL